MLTVLGEVSGDASRQLRELMERLQATRPLVARMAQHSADSQRRNIDERHMPDGTAFEPLKESTLRKRGLSSHPFGDAPLKDTGLMYEGIHAETLSDTEATAGPFGLEAYYYRFQNQGTRTIPARTFIGESEADFETFQADAYEFASAAVEGSSPGDVE